MKKWSEESIKKWWDAQKWQVGTNFFTSNAVNDIEMWMDATYDPERIRQDLSMLDWAGLNSVRVFLSYVVWKNEGSVFEKNFDNFLQIAADAGFTVVPILFDDCAFDNGSDPVYGPQPEPIYGVHNSRWVPSPGFAIQDDPNQLEACKDYVDAMVGAHSKDSRILFWDLYNEPGNTGRCEKCLPLLVKAFEWARAHDPIQPITSGAWNFEESFVNVNSTLFELSDIISIHTYSPIEVTRQRVEMAKRYNRPVLVTEWLHRPLNNTYETHLPYFHQEKIGIWQGGAIQGRIQTHLNWDTMGKDGIPDPNPDLWQHDILYPDGTPYRQGEIDLIRSLVKS